MTSILAGAAALALLVLAPAGAIAESKSPAYVGKWGDAASCKLEQDVEGAPIIMKRNGYDQHETHCTFSAMKARGDTWTGKSRCQVEGSTQRNTITLKVSGDTLTINEGPGPRTLQRCQ